MSILLVGVVPIVNLEWIQKLIRDTGERGHSREAVMDSVVRSMEDYISYITPQFSRTHINFQRVPTVDTSNPFAAKAIPSLDESLVAIHFRGLDQIRLPLPAGNAARIVYLAYQYAGGAWRQDGAGNGTDHGTAGAAADGRQENRVKSSYPSSALIPAHSYSGPSVGLILFRKTINSSSETGTLFFDIAMSWIISSFPTTNSSRITYTALFYIQSD